MVDLPDPRTWVKDDLLDQGEANREIADTLRFLSSGAPQTVLWRDSDQSIPNATATAISFNRELVDVENGHSSSYPSRLIIATPGVYDIIGQITYGGGAGGIRQALLRVNGTDMRAVTGVRPYSTPSCTVTVPALLPLRQGDYVELMAYHDAGAALNALNFGGSPRLVARWTGAVTDDPVPPEPPPEPSPPPTSPTPRKYTAYFDATWSRTFDGDGSTTWDDSAYCYQGYYDGNRGNTRSAVGFSSAVQSTLAGATNIRMWLSFTVVHSYYNSGVTAVIGAHNWASKPASWNSANVATDRTRRASCAPGNWYRVELPSDFGRRFQTGQWKGIVFGPGPTTSRSYYGYFRGATQQGRPRLSIEYWK